MQKLKLATLYGILPSVKHKSFLKWAGGKMQLLDKLMSIMPPVNKQRYLEPFVGSGVIALNVHYPEIIISDVNPALINLWRTIKNDGEHLISVASSLFLQKNNNEKSYYEFREIFNNHLKSGKLDTMTAGLFLYLNKHGFNRLCRFNADGKFNVPFNHRKTNPNLPELELRHAIDVTQRMKIYQNTFVNIFATVKSGDVIYCDPPYCPRSESSSFTQYSSGGFDIFQHTNLVYCALDAQSKGATVIISNNDIPLTRKLYDTADEIYFVDVAKKISCKANGRKKLQEIIAVYRPK